MLNPLIGSNGSKPIDLAENLIAHYLLNNNADDSHGDNDGTEVGTVNFTGDYLDPLSGSVTIPATGGNWCSYWKDTGSGFVLITSAIIPSSLATDNYSNLRVYTEVKSGAFLNALEDEGYYPKPLPLPTTDGLVAHYPLTGTAEDTTGTYDGTENSATYKDDTEFGSVYDGGGSITVNATAVGLTTWCCYWVDTGSGWVFTKTTTIPSTLTTNDYRNLRLYSSTPSVALQDEIYNYEKNFRPIDIDNGLVAYYPLANNSLDNYNNEFDGVDTAMTYDGLSGVFSGNSQAVISNSMLGSTHTEFTQSMWLKIPSIPTADETFYNHHYLDDIYHKVRSTGKISMGVRLANFAYISIYSDEPLETNKYVHVVCVNGLVEGMKLYIDGVLQVDQKAGNGTRDDTYTNKHLFGSVAGDTQYFNGNIALGRIYNKAITAEQVAVIYNTEKGDFI